MRHLRSKHHLPAIGSEGDPVKGSRGGREGDGLGAGDRSDRFEIRAGISFEMQFSLAPVDGEKCAAYQRELRWLLAPYLLGALGLGLREHDKRGAVQDGGGDDFTKA
jgi:hypothetical protein